ncbi:Programmed cell death toxin MazF [hydrothermal vent metagenome]|uniref:Programmed cell death toxin MazF n=1 Tax=hydrothermal vent metagenome TaxID=652676 RepID=A0A3B0V538_9ZZZZ
MYIPDRGDIVWLDFEPTKGKEIGKYRPALVYSSKDYSRATLLMICSPISTSIRNTPSEVGIDNLDIPSVVVTNIVLTMSWKERGIKYESKVSKKTYDDVLTNLLPLITGKPY